MTPVIGIDLGTTNSLVAIVKDGTPQIITDGENRMIPSVVAYSEEGKALAVGARAKTLKNLDPRNVFYSFKRFMGKGLNDIEKLATGLPFDFSHSTQEMIRLTVNQTAVTPVELSAEVLKKCRRVAEDYLGQPVRKAVITVPAYFDDAQRSATQLAGKLAGLEVLRVVNEPTAASLAYGIGSSSSLNKRNIAIYDFGGGTFDITILSVSQGIFQVLSTAGNTHLGGDDIDIAFLNHLVGRERIQFLSSDDFSLALSQVEQFKIALTESESIDATLHWGGSIQWTGKILRDDFNQIANSVVEQTFICCRDAVQQSGLKISEIDEVILVGGTTRVPLVSEKVRSFFEKNPKCSINPDEAVALGAAVQAAVLAGDVTDTVLLDVVPLSVGLVTMGGLVSKMIHRNSTIPVAHEEIFTTYVDNQTGIDFHIVQGERELEKDCRSLGRFKLKVDPAPAGITKVKVRFQLDASGVLVVQAKDLKSDRVAQLEVKPSFGLTDKQVEEMLQAGWAHADEDFHNRRRIEAVQQAETLIRSTVKALSSPLLEEDFRSRQNALLDPVIKALRADMDSGHSAVILSRVQELESLTQELAQTIMNRSINAALKSKSVESFAV